MADATPLALLPGLLCDQALWQPQLDALEPQAICWVADFTSQESTGAMAESVLAAMPERFALAGLSMGGYVALEVFARAPERVERIALLDTRAGPDSPEERSRRRGLIELAEKGQFKGVTPRLLPMFIHPSRLNDDNELPGAVTAMAARVGRDAFIRQQKAILSREDRRPVLANIACPALVLCGRQDLLTPVVFHEEMAATIPGSHMVVVEDCGHLSTMEKPEEVNRALMDWLRDA